MSTQTRFVCIVVMIALAMPADIVRAQSSYSTTQKYYNAQPTAQPAAAQPAGVKPAAARPAAAAAATGPASAPVAGSPATPLKPEELEQVVAPIALYPDSLLAQVLMASTYPLEVVQADRWAKQNPKGKDSPDTLNKLPWDPSVKSLLDFPQVLTMMSEKLDWTVKLGDAFIADQKALMDAVQRLRGKAYANGNLKSSKEQTVKVEPASATAPVVAGQAPAPQVIVVESSSPSVVYVPTYNPTVVYGSWPYPSYPPAYYYPPGYVAGAAVLSFGIGVACGAAWGNAWGGCNWNGGEVDIDVNRNVNFNGNIDREAARAKMEGRQGERDTRQGERQAGRDTRQGERQGNRTGGASKFQHDASHRQGVAYRDQATNERFRGSQASQQQVAARDAYRGRAETGRQDISRGAADAYRGSGAGVGNSGARAAGDLRGGTGRTPTASNYSGTRSSGFSGSNYSGSSARADSTRGQASRSSSGYSGSRGGSSGYSGASRGGGGYSGGGSRGGGGGGGMRGGGGGRGGGGRR